MSKHYTSENAKQAFYSGLEHKTREIKEMGFVAARDKLNVDYPLGQPWNGSEDGRHFMLGECEALLSCL